MSNLNLDDYNAMRDVYVDAVIDIAKTNKNVLWFDADLKSCINSTKFQKEFPDRFFNCGIAESNMVGVACGTASLGFVPFVHTFGIFATRRVYDQVFLSSAYAGNTIHIVGTDPGVTAQMNGGTHMPFEDVALMRAIPNMVVYEPSDAYSLWKLVHDAFVNGRSSYCRIPRKAISKHYTSKELNKIQLGKGVVVKKGKDITIVSSGMVMFDEATEAICELEKKGISVNHIDIHTVKPLDTDLILKAAKGTKGIIVCENSRKSGALGEAIASYLSCVHPTKMDYVCVDENTFGEVGKQAYLIERFGLSRDVIVKKALALLK